MKNSKKVIVLFLFLETLCYGQIDNKKIDYDNTKLVLNIVFINKGEEGDYFVEIDGKVYKNIEHLEIVSKKVAIRIKQQRLLTEHTILNKEYALKPKDNLEIVFEIPYLLETEKTYIKTNEKLIDEFFQDENMWGYLEKKLNELIMEFEDTKFNPKLIEYNKKYKEKLSKLLLMMEKKKKEKEAKAVEDRRDEAIEKALEKEKEKTFLSIYSGIVVSGLWYPVEETYATKIGGGFDFGFSISLKDNLQLGHFLALTFEPSVCNLILGITPALVFNIKEIDSFSMNFTPLELGLRFDYVNELATKYGLTTSIGIDYKNAYLRFSFGGVFQNNLSLRVAIGFKNSSEIFKEKKNGK